MSSDRRPGRDTLPGLRIEDQGSGRSWRVHIGRDLDRAIGQPDYVVLSRRGNALHIRPAEEHMDGRYSVIRVGNSIPRISIGKSMVEELHLEEGRFEAAVKRGQIVCVFASL